jgi:multimeric flavodoxin WrbA
MLMKVLAISGSGRKDGNTVLLINHIFDELHHEGIETELIQLAGHLIRGCTVCNLCIKRKDRRCAIGNDPVNDCIEKMAAADGIILASPTYFSDISPELKALIDRSGRVGRANDFLYKRKVGASVMAVRRGGAIHAFDTINHFFHIAQMIVPGAIYWNVGIGSEIGDVENDAEGVETMKSIGRNMSWLLKKINQP